jgi:hypothetical protein
LNPFLGHFGRLKAGTSPAITLSARRKLICCADSPGRIQPTDAPAPFQAFNTSAGSGFGLTSSIASEVSAIAAAKTNMNQ